MIPIATALTGSYASAVPASSMYFSFMVLFMCLSGALLLILMWDRHLSQLKLDVADLAHENTHDHLMATLKELVLHKCMGPRRERIHRTIYIFCRWEEGKYGSRLDVEILDPNQPTYGYRSQHWRIQLRKELESTHPQFGFTFVVTPSHDVRWGFIVESCTNIAQVYNTLDSLIEAMYGEDAPRELHCDSEATMPITH